MAYVGTPLDTTNAFQSLAGKRFSGDASTTDFTLDSSPNSTLDIEVFVENVRQDPNSAYTVSGTTLGFTAAPPSGTNNIYVVHQAKAVGTIGIPDDTVNSQTDIGANIADADLFLIDDGAGGTLRKTTAARIKTYAGGAAADDISAGDGAVSLSTTSGNITIENDASDADIIFKVNDGGSDKTVFTIDGSDNGKLIFQDDVAAISLDKLIGKHDTNTGIDFGVTVGSGDASAADPSDVISLVTGGDEMLRLVTERTNYTTLAVGDTANVNYRGYSFVHGHEATQNGGSMIGAFEHQGTTSPYGIQIKFSGASPDNNTQYFLNCVDGTASRCNIESDGDLQNHDNSYGSISDSRIKDNIADASSQWDDIKALKVRKFKMKDDILQYGADNATYKLGLIAQETEAVSPGLIKKE